MLISLKETSLESLSPSQVGGKALGIRWLQAQGYPVPDTWVLSTEAFDEMVRKTGIAGHIAVLESVTEGRPDWAIVEMALQGLGMVRREIEQALRDTPLPEVVGEALNALPKNEPYWAVRSSATVEDGSTHSFAGQFRSFLSVPRSELRRAIRAVWASAFDKHVLHYRAMHMTTMPRMAVILQPMSPITAEDRSGVAFSKSPLPGMPGILLQATYGAGVPVVDGTGGEIKCVRGSEVTTRQQRTPHIVVSASDGGLQELPAQDHAVLSDAEAKRLAEQVAEIAELYGGPADVEFVWPAHGDPVFVQVRMITS